MRSWGAEMRTRIDSCYQCPDRYPGCHAECEKYQKQKEEYEATRAERQAKEGVQYRLYNQACDSVHKRTKYEIYRIKYR